MIKRIACDVYSRIVGYIRPLADWNKGKQQEWQDRKTYDVKEVKDDDAHSEIHLEV